MKMFYTVHARQRMGLRVISEEEVVEAIENGVYEEQEEYKFQVVYGKVRIVFVVNQEEEVVTVITVIHSKEFQKQVKKHAKKNKISQRQAAKALKEVA